MDDWGLEWVNGNDCARIRGMGGGGDEPAGETCNIGFALIPLRSNADCGSADLLHLANRMAGETPDQRFGEIVSDNGRDGMTHAFS